MLMQVYRHRDTRVSCVFGRSLPPHQRGCRAGDRGALPVLIEVGGQPHNG